MLDVCDQCLMFHVTKSLQQCYEVDSIMVLTMKTPRLKELSNFAQDNTVSEEQSQDTL